jgi:Domain of unknown function (DUF4383)
MPVRGDHQSMNDVWRDSRRPLDRLHRIGAVIFGLGLAVFGVLGLVNRLEPFSTEGQPVLGLSSNGLLSVISLVVGGILVVSGLRGGRTASTILVVIGAAFVLSGVANVLVLDTPLNLLAFRMSNVIFSLVAGALLLFLGAWGRFTGGLPDDNPYQQERHQDDDPPPQLPTTFRDTDDATAASELAEAERAVAQHAATPEQEARVEAIRDIRRAEDRVRAWREHDARS